MSNPTSNFGWQMPTATDLVTDLPADFEVFGQAVDTALMDLKGGTTNQVLAKNSNTDMDFKWVSDATGMTNPMTTTGDTIYSSSGSTPARLGIGTAGQILRVNSGATAPEWATPAASGASFALLSTTTLSTGTEYSITGLSGYNQFMVVYNNVSSSAGARFEFRLNNDSTASGRYRVWGADAYAASGTTGVLFPFFEQVQSYIPLGVTINAADIINGAFLITGGNSTGFKQIVTTNAVSAVAGADSYLLTGLYEGTSVISSIQFRCSAGAFDAGTLRIYGSVA
jgi:hypothetical protein